MTWKLTSDRPIYIQLVEKLQLYIITGIYRPGEKLPSVRDLASEASVNPNTMQKALTELERGGLVYTQRTAGRFVTDDQTLIRHIRMELAASHIREFISTMRQFGMSDHEILNLIEEIMKEEIK